MPGARGAAVKPSWVLLRLYLLVFREGLAALPGYLYLRWRSPERVTPFLLERAAR